MVILTDPWKFSPSKVFRYAVYRVGPGGISHPYNSDLKPLPTPCTVYVIIPQACAKGKAISFVCLSVVVCCRHEITRSWVLGICVCCNCHKLVDIGKKTGFCGLRIAEHGSLALQIVYFPFSMPVVYWLHLLHVVLTWLNCTCSTFSM